MTVAIDPRILSQLAAHDYKVEECKQALASHQKRLKTLDELEREYAGEVAEAKAHRDELKMAVHQAELEVAEWRRQTKVHQGHLNEIADSRAWRALNEEIRYLQRQIDEKEESTLTVMEEAEKAEKTLSQAQEVLRAKREEIEAERGQIQVDMEKLRERLARFETAREAFYAEVPPVIRSYYERRGRRQSMPVVWMAEGGSCSYCHSRLTPQAQLEVTTAKKLVVCESCGRVIVAAPVVPVSSSGDQTSEHS